MKTDEKMENIIKCAKVIQTYCDTADCIKCVFRDKKDGGCILNNDSPLFWDLEDKP